MIYQTSMATPIGDLVIQSNDTAVVSVSFESEASTALFPATIMISGKTMPAVLRQAVEELQQYFDGQRKEFTVPLYMEGTEFRMKAWKALQAIPYGEVRSYQQQAEAIGNRKATRAIGGANHNNRISIIVPCHRVIGKNSKLVGFGGGLERKQWLLDHELKWK